MDHRLARCHLLAEVLIADGIVTDEEHALLEQHLAHYGLSEEERRQVRTFEGAKAAIASLRARPAPERQELLDDLVEAALVDKKLRKNETATVKRIAEALGLDD